MTAPDDVRWGSIQRRDQEFVQTTEVDTHEKGKLVPERIQDTFLAHADQIEFYYREAVDGDAKLAATWADKQVIVIDTEGYGRIKEIHNAAVKDSHPELLWEKAVEVTSPIERR